MEWRNVVWFAGHPKPFLIKEACCTNPDCSCTDVGLTFREIDETGGGDFQPLTFCINVDLETGQECNPRPRSAQEAGWVREFLSSWSQEKRTEVRARIDRSKQTARRLAEYRIDRRRILEGDLLSYADVVDESGALSSGGRSFTYLVVHQGREYQVEDLYCPNPACDCRQVQLQFWTIDSRYRDGVEHVTIAPLFLARLKFSGRKQLTLQRDGCTRERAEAIYAAWWDRYQGDLPMFEARYQEVKEIGRRSLETAGIPAALEAPPAEVTAALRGLLESEVAEADLPPAHRRRIGRNDPCPCGSGRKYKKCCG